jgi:hypothetical protein
LKRFTGQASESYALEISAVLVVLMLLAAQAAQAQNGATRKPAASAQAPASQTERTRYRLNYQLDFDGRAYKGTERIRWVNTDDRPASVLYFHLYANMRVPLPRSATPASAPDEPRLEINEVHLGDSNASQPFSLDEQATILRVNLREPVAPNSSVEIEIGFKGSVPEIDSEETGRSATGRGCAAQRARDAAGARY